MDTDPNPYKPPVAAEPPYGMPYETAVPSYRVEGRYLIVQSGAELPQRCVRSNQKITERDMRRKTLEWCSPWVALSILISVCVTVILYVVLRKKCELTFGLHPSVRRRYHTRIVIKLLITVGLFFAMPMAAAADIDWLIVITILLFICSIIVLLVGNSPLKITTHRVGEFWIKGCSPEFLADLSKGDPFAQTPIVEKGF